MIAITNCPARVKNHALSAFSPEEVRSRLLRWKDTDTSLARIDEAQGRIVGAIRRWEEEEIIEVLGPDNPDPKTGMPLLRLKKKG